jgi:hypothetical protein
MLQHSRLDSSPPLDPFCSSPVRGQLEAYDPRTPKGWRYIQTTDTPNQLKVGLQLAIAKQTLTSFSGSLASRNRIYV